MALVAACGGAQPAPTADAHAHAHGPLVHRFENAEKWAREFDDPKRDEWQHPKEVIAAMGITSGMTVADVGAGTGYFEPWLSRAVGENGTVLALDVEADMVRYLGERAVREKLSNVRASQVALDDPKLPPAGVDRVLIVDTWHHIADRAPYAAKLRSGLKPGGKVFVVDFTLEAKHGPPPHHRVGAKQVLRELAAAGLTANVVASLPEQYIVAAEAP